MKTAPVEVVRNTKNAVGVKTNNPSSYFVVFIPLSPLYFARFHF